ncbi:MAG: malto-oligosyltrehalose trehalohydrolase [Deltaproteobacteria bacterium]|nr:malto-oligosyltrehalose trehalohydrolase [Deltaproteobacteria bacterium]
MTTHDSTPPSESAWSDGPNSDAPSTRRAAIGVDSALVAHGARPMLDGTGTAFRVWAPDRESVQLVLFDRSTPPKELRRLGLARQHDGFHVGSVSGLGPGDRYMLSPDGEGPFPDPASRFQPLGVHGPSEIVDVRSFQWTDARWRGCPLEDLVVYELHVGTATPEGTFRALIEKLDHVRALGATAVELMPLADFAGDRNWGYDGVCPFAPARCYGRPEDLAALIDAAHARGLAVILDVVYNHLGPEGNYLRRWSERWFDEAHHTPWGPALNFGVEAVRTFVLENAAYWVRDFHFDGLRLDATHAIVDTRDRGEGTHLLTELADVARAAASEREVLLIAEDERNEARLVREVSRGGLGLDATWADDFHHEVRRIIAGDHEGWFADFEGTTGELAKILQKGWLYDGQMAPSRGAPRGTPAFDLPPPRLVHCVQNHDQVGNRATGDRLSHGVVLGRYRAAIALLLSTPFTPLLFMGQEFAASTPFAYFTSHEGGLGHLVTEGRRAEFAKFEAFRDPARRSAIPDPQAPDTFARSKLDWSDSLRSPGKEILALHRALLQLRREEPAMAATNRVDYDVAALGRDLLAVRRRPRRLGEPLLFVVGLRAGGTVDLAAHAPTAPPEGRDWHIEIDTESPTYGGDSPARLAGATLTLASAGAVVLRARAQRANARTVSQ